MYREADGTLEVVYLEQAFLGFAFDPCLYLDVRSEARALNFRLEQLVELEKPAELFISTSTQIGFDLPGPIFTFSIAAADREWMLTSPCSNGIRDRP